MNETEMQELFDRLRAMLVNDMLIIVKTDQDEHVICELWKDKKNDAYSIYPWLKVLTEEEKEEMTLDGMQTIPS